MYYMVRYNDALIKRIQEEQMLTMLSNHFEEDKSTLIKHSLNEMYEDLVDKRVIDDFEKEEGTVHFVSADDILKSL